MNTTFHDLQNESNPRNGLIFSDRETVTSLLQVLRTVEPPFMCQFTRDHEFNLIIGVAHDSGCVQHSANSGLPPFLMAVSSTGPANRSDMEFLVGDTPTPIDDRYRIDVNDLCEVVAEFVATGKRSARVFWEELA